MEYIDLLLDSGELVRIECPTKHYDACMESLEHTMKRKEWWSHNQFEGCKAEYIGLPMSRVAMHKVVGIL